MSDNRSRGWGKGDPEALGSRPPLPWLCPPGFPAGVAGSQPWLALSVTNRTSLFSPPGCEDWPSLRPWQHSSLSGLCTPSLQPASHNRH